MSEYIGVDAAGVKRATGELEQADEGIGEVRTRLSDARSQYESPPVWGTDEIGDGFQKNYQPLADRLTQLLEHYHETLTGKDGLPSLMNDSVDKFGKVDQASADGFDAAARTLEA
ncbi:hypothetical protein [Nocardia sp. NPDC005998]|uniref:hypothetical protein n=1 Tax=Nocardia sp. NPDC005998 TaxID=3156894 RepID=UPI0033A79125